MEEYPQKRTILKNGTIRIEGRDDNGTGFGYWRFEDDGVLRNQVGLSIESGKYIRVTTTDGYQRIPIAKEEYDRIKKEMEGDGQVVKLDWKPIAEYRG